MDWKKITGIAAPVAAGLAALVSYVTLGGPIVATRGWVEEKLRPLVCQSLANQRHINSIDLFQWQQNPVVTQGIQEQIDKLRSQSARIEAAAAAMNCP